jgi:hypothetical protein
VREGSTAQIQPGFVRGSLEGARTGAGVEDEDEIGAFIGGLLVIVVADVAERMAWASA